ncbi:hypothetical protein [Ruminococcus sp.]|uniref:hypothetical protein n=1 Tax=Ruminococcus sp. TaxID=41978 RepID=UPI00388EFA80
MKKKHILAIILAVTISTLFFMMVIVYLYNNTFSDPSIEHDVIFDEMDSKTQIEKILNDYIDTYNYNLDLLSLNFTLKENCLYVFFDFTPHENSIVLNGLNYEQVKNYIFYGYARVEKKHDQYFVTDFQTSMCDEKSNKHLSWADTSQGNRHVCYGKIINSNIQKIEFYENNTLIETYLLSGNKYYLVPLMTESEYSSIDFRAYDNNNCLIVSE